MCKHLEKESKFDFYDACLIAFGELKKKFVSAPTIIVADWGEPFEVMCDASGVALGVVLGKMREKMLHHIYYATKELNAAQTN